MFRCVGQGEIPSCQLPRGRLARRQHRVPVILLAAACAPLALTIAGDQATSQVVDRSGFSPPTMVDTLRPREVKTTPYELEKVDQLGNRENHFLGCVIADLDGDSWDEMATFSRAEGNSEVGSIIWIDFPNGQRQTVGQVNSTDFQLVFGDYRDDLNGDGAVDLVVGCRSGSEAWGVVYGVRGQQIAMAPRVTGPDNDASGEWDGHLLPLRAIDLDGDGQRDLLSRVFGVFDKEPRGLLAYDVARQDTLWFFRSGAPITERWIYPLVEPETGSRLLLVAAYSVANGSEDGGISDRYSHLFLLDMHGRLVRSRRLGGSCSGITVKIDDLDRNGRLDAVVTLGGNLQYPEAMTGILVLDPFTLEERFSVDPGCFLGEPHIHDLDADGRNELMVQTGQEILIYDDQLRLKTQIPFDKDVVIQEITDVTGDGRPDIIASFDMGRIIGVLTPTGDWLAVTRPPGEGAGWVRSLEWGPRRRLLYSLGTKLLVGYTLRRADDELMAPRDTPPDNGQGQLLLIGAGLLAGLLGGGALALALIARRNGQPITWLLQAQGVGAAPGNPTERQSEHRIALTQLTAFGHGEPGAVLARAATLLQAANPDLVADRQWREEVVETCDTLQRTIPPALTELLASRRVFGKFNLSGAELERGLREIVADIDGLRLGFRSREAMAPDAFAATGQRIRDLDEQLRRLRLDLRASFRCDVPAVVNATLAMKRQVLREAGVADYGVTMRGEGSFIAQIDGHRLQFEILDDLVSNAARAMRDTASRSLSVEVRQVGSNIEVRVTDTGCGIEPDMRHSIFDRGVSTKADGGGLGLYQARQAVKDFGGRIFVEETAPGAGTTVIVALPAVQASI